MLAAGSKRGEQVFGLGSALASAMRKVVDALPESHRATASDADQRFLVDPETDQTLGFEAIYLGSARLTRSGSPVQARTCRICLL